MLLLGPFHECIPRETPGGTVHVPAFDLPSSGLLSSQTRDVLQRQAREIEALATQCPLDTSSLQSVVARRRCVEKHYYPTLIARHRTRYPVTIEPEVIAGVPTEIIAPVAGTSLRNRDRVLINLHSGGFVFGGRWGGQVESIPIAAVGKFRVVSVDYRMAPEYRFPAASEDVAAVYRELLKTYKSQSIGIYGCSAGGLLTAQAVAWLQAEGLPRPGAVGMFCAAGRYYGEGDSGPFVASLMGFSADRLTASNADLYLKHAMANDPLAFPARSEQVLAKFPPSLLITSTRDQALSSVAHMHSRLVAHGIAAELHVWEGLGHAFFLEPDLAESREVYAVTARFFDRYLQ